MFEWSIANRKLAKTREAWERRFGGRARFVGFSLPQLRSTSGKVTCPFAGDCADVCYAGQSTFFMPHVRAKYERNLTAVLKARDELGALLTDELAGDDLKTVTHVRLHDSGDFFAPWYYRAWLEVARALPDLMVYGYTKSVPLLQPAQHPHNFRFTMSLGGKRDDLVDLARSHSRIFASGTERRAAGYVNGNLDDLPVLLRETRIGLVYHGTTKLREEHLVKLRKAP